ncbi:MAG: hypothetical protein H6617_07380 [Bdellovibrionaceae bacterium]|nr:hypothetical protein [Pseudobdellovibrionaceae bacterium]
MRQKLSTGVTWALLLVLLLPHPLRASEDWDHLLPDEPAERSGETEKPVADGEQQRDGSTKEKNADRVLREMRDELSRYHEGTEANNRRLFEEVQKAADDRRSQRRATKVLYTCVLAFVSVGIVGAFFLGGGEHPLADQISVEKKLVAYDETQVATAQLVMSQKVKTFENPAGEFDQAKLLPTLASLGSVVRTELATGDGKGKIPNGLWRVLYEADSDGSVSDAAEREGLVEGALIGDSFGKIRDFLKRADETQMERFDRVFAVALLRLLENSRTFANGLDGPAVGGTYAEMTLGSFLYQEVLPLARLGAGASVQNGERFRIDPP